ncbi:MAG TPA: hypothetical protein VG898_11205 [Solirubrobacterales bacterium]|nr:hypothetical protein [Solirubrobacterales bacterium]
MLYGPHIIQAFSLISGLPARIAAALAACLVAGLLATACGGGSDSTASLSKAQIVKQGEAICKKAKKEQTAALAKLAGKSKQGKPDQQFLEEVVIEVALPPIQTAAEELAAIGVPQEIVSGFETAIGEGESDPSGVAGGPKTTPFKEVNAKAAAYGLATCATLA